MLSLVLLLIALVEAGVIVWLWQRPTSPPPQPLRSQKALLLNPAGLLESVRTLTGEPPDAIICAAGTYRLDRTALSDHWIYRR